MQALLFYVLRLQTCWRMVAGFGFVRYLGLDWSGVAVKMNLLGVKPKERARLTEQLEALELAGLAALNRRTERDG